MVRLECNSRVCLQVFSLCVATIGFLAFALVLALVEQAFLEGLEEVLPSSTPAMPCIMLKRGCLQTRAKNNLHGAFDSALHMCRMCVWEARCSKLATSCSWPLEEVLGTGRCCSRSPGRCAGCLRVLASWFTCSLRSHHRVR